MERTIKNRSIEEAFQLLRAPYTGDKKKKEGKSYIPAKGFQKRMDEVFDPCNIWVEFTEPKFITVAGTGQELFIVTCHLTIYDDSGNIFRKSDGIGAMEILVTKETGKQSGLGNKPASTATQAYKDACKRLGIFDESPDDESESKEKEETSRQTMEFATQGAFKERKTGKNSSWRCPILIKKGASKGQKSELVVFQNVYTSQEDIQRLVAMATNQTKYTVNAEVTFNKEYGNYVLNKIV